MKKSTTAIALGLLMGFSLSALANTPNEPSHPQSNIPLENSTPQVSTPASPHASTSTPTPTPTATSLPKHWCERHPERCEEMREERKAKEEKWCKMHPRKCAERRKHQEAQTH